MIASNETDQERRVSTCSIKVDRENTSRRIFRKKINFLILDSERQDPIYIRFELSAEEWRVSNDSEAVIYAHCGQKINMCVFYFKGGMLI
jgi:hypothetical protein